MGKKTPLAALLHRRLDHGDLSAVCRALRFAPRRLASDALEDRLDVIVSTDQIAGSSGRVSTRFFFVAPGDWDREIRPLTQFRAWRVMVSIHAAEGDWRRSTELEPMLARVRQGYRGGRDYPMRNRRDVERYFATRAELWTRCREEGIWTDRHSPIRLRLGRKGVCFKASDGAHRLCCALLLGQRCVPGRIWQVHPLYLESFVRTLLERPAAPAGSVGCTKWLLPDTDRRDRRSQ